MAQLLFLVSQICYVPSPSGRIWVQHVLLLNSPHLPLALAVWFRYWLWCSWTLLKTSPASSESLQNHFLVVSRMFALKPSTGLLQPSLVSWRVATGGKLVGLVIYPTYPQKVGDIPSLSADSMEVKVGISPKWMIYDDKCLLKCVPLPYLLDIIHKLWLHES